MSLGELRRNAETLVEGPMAKGVPTQRSISSKGKKRSAADPSLP
jgi:hypothetical protein